MRRWRSCMYQILYHSLCRWRGGGCTGLRTRRVGTLGKGGGPLAACKLVCPQRCRRLLQQRRCKSEAPMMRRAYLSYARVTAAYTVRVSATMQKQHTSCDWCGMPALRQQQRPYDYEHRQPGLTLSLTQCHVHTTGTLRTRWRRRFGQQARRNSCRE